MINIGPLKGKIRILDPTIRREPRTVRRLTTGATMRPAEMTITTTMVTGLSSQEKDDPGQNPGTEKPNEIRLQIVGTTDSDPDHLHQIEVGVMNKKGEEALTDPILGTEMTKRTIDENPVLVTIIVLGPIPDPDTTDNRDPDPKVDTTPETLTEEEVDLVQTTSELMTLEV